MMDVQPQPRRSSLRPFLFRGVLSLTGLAALTVVPALSAQTTALTPAVRPVQTEALLAGSLPFASFSSSAAPAEAPAAAPDPGLPEAPVPQLAVQPTPKSGTDPNQKIASKRTLTIPSGWHAQPLTAHDKVILGTQDLYSYLSFAAIFASAGYEHVLNSAPNYGTDKGAFGDRLGAAGLRESSQTVLTEIVLAPLLHEDPRYYVKGPSYNPVKRTLYAITRPLITRSDNGNQTINGALLLGYAGAAAITPAYYPQSNRNFRDVASVYGGSIGGAALGDFLIEFSQDVLQSLHLYHQQ